VPLRVLTSNRAVSLQTVAMDIVKVALKAGVKARWQDRTVPSFELRKAGESAIVVMAVDPLIATPWFLLVRDCLRGGVRAVFYGTIEGKVNTMFVRDWMREVAFIANSGYTRDKLVEAGFSVLDVVPHGIDLDAVRRARRTENIGHSYLARFGLNPEKHLIVLTIANSHPRKGLAWFDKVVEEVEKRDKSVKFLVVTEEKGLRYFNPRENLTVAAEFGKLPRLTVLSLIASAHIFALPSLAEGFGLPVLEAMALGTPVVHGELPPVMEFSTGFTVPVKEIRYFDRMEVGPSGIVYEQHLYDVREFAEVILQVCDLWRNKPEAVGEWRSKSVARAREFDIHTVYPRLVKQLAGEEMFEQ